MAPNILRERVRALLSAPDMTLKHNNDNSRHISEQTSKLDDIHHGLKITTNKNRKGGIESPNDHLRQMLHSIDIDYQQRCIKIQEKLVYDTQNQINAWVEAREKLYKAELQEKINQFTKTALLEAEKKHESTQSQALMLPEHTALMEDHCKKLKELHLEREELAQKKRDFLRQVEFSGEEIALREKRLEGMEKVLESKQQEMERIRISLQEERICLQQERAAIEQQQSALISREIAFERRQDDNDSAWKVEKQMFLEQIDRLHRELALEREEKAVDTQANKNIDNYSSITNQHDDVELREWSENALRHAEDIRLWLCAAVREINTISTTIQVLLGYTNDDTSLDCDDIRKQTLPIALLFPLLKTILNAQQQIQNWSEYALQSEINLKKQKRDLL